MIRQQAKIGFWKNSLVRRYLAFSLLIAILPLSITAVLYDSLTANLLKDMDAQQDTQQLRQSQSSMEYMMRQHRNALRAISELPGINQLLQPVPALTLPRQILNLIYFDIDRPEIYGAILFDRDWQLKRAFPGQSASGYPYWGEGNLNLAALPRFSYGEALLLGPQKPLTAQSGWYLMAFPLSADLPDEPSPGFIAFQIRLASFTQHLPPILSEGGAQSCLRVEALGCFDSLGRWSDSLPENVISLPLWDGWALAMSPRVLPSLGTNQQRLLLALMAMLSVIGVCVFFYLVVLRIRGRVVPLIHAADAISHGQWDTRITPRGNDEIALLATAFNQMTSRLNALLIAQSDMERKAVWGEFATGIAHEIRNPLATIKVCVQALPEQDDESRELRGLMVTEIDRINHLISNLLDYALPPQPNGEPVLLSGLLHRLHVLVSPLAKDKGVLLSTDECCPYAVMADAGQLQQILMNLLINAVDATAPGGEVQMSFIEDAKGPCVVVKDTGEGMTEKQIAMVTEPFYTTKTTGTGLGLAVSLCLAKQNHAELGFDSMPGHGTAVTLRFDKDCICEPETNTVNY